jgi:hypothetical protein
MADASRFPALALPFAVVGAAAGWLSAGLCSNPLLGCAVSRPRTAVLAALLAALTGAVLKRLCVGRRYSYQLDDPDPARRPWTDRAALQAAVVLAAGALTGVLVALPSDRLSSYVPESAGGGAACALVFLPVCLAVVAAARRAQRARLGSLVAGSDRRAVWGILTLSLAVTTLEALPDWEAALRGDLPAPLFVPAALVAAAALTAAILRADLRAARAARAAVEAGGSTEDAGAELEEGAAARLDLGLGEGRLARFARGASAYRQKERVVSLVRGSPAQALGALRRASLRGVAALAILALVGGAHLAAHARPARGLYEAAYCDRGYTPSCALASELIRDVHPGWARRLRARAFGAESP